MNRRTKIIVSVSGIFIVTLALIGLTYAYFLTRINGNTNAKSISVTTTNLELTYGDGNGVITGSNIMPGTTLTSKTFSVYNNGSQATSYVIKLENVTNTFNRTQDWTYSLKKGDVEVKSGIVTSNEEQVLFIDSIESKKTNSFTLILSYIEPNKDQSEDMGKSLSAKVNIGNVENVFKNKPTNSLLYAIGRDNIVTESLTIPGEQISGIYRYEQGEFENELHTYSVSSSFQNNYITYGEDFEFNNKNGTYSLIGIQKEKYSSIYSNLIGKYLLVPQAGYTNFLNSATYEPDTSGLEMLYQIVDATSSSITYKEVSIATPINIDESSFSKVADDYGTSYYYRGAVENNYLNFSGMCWRVLRVQGDGSIKIILADRDHECDNAGYSINNEDSAFITPTSELFLYNYIIAGLDAIKYENSEILDVLNAWLNGGNYTYYKDGSSTKYSGTFAQKIDLSKLVNTDWCNDVSNTSIENDNYTNGYKYLYFGAYDRLESDINNINPTLKCNSVGINDTKSLKYNGNIGVITADEAVFAGFVTYNYRFIDLESFSNNYLKANTASRCYWSNSVRDVWYDSINDEYYERNMYHVCSNGLSSNYVDYNPYSESLRPVVALSPDVEILSGNGTQSNPYKIK